MTGYRCGQLAHEYILFSFGIDIHMYTYIYTYVFISKFLPAHIGSYLTELAPIPKAEALFEGLS